MNTWSKRIYPVYVVKRVDNAFPPDKSLSTFIRWIVLSLKNWYQLLRFPYTVRLPTGSSAANPEINIRHTRRFGATRAVVHLGFVLLHRVVNPVVCFK